MIEFLLHAIYDSKWVTLLRSMLCFFFKWSRPAILEWFTLIPLYFRSRRRRWRYDCIIIWINKKSVFFIATCKQVLHLLFHICNTKHAQHRVSSYLNAQKDLNIYMYSHSAHLFSVYMYTEHNPKRKSTYSMRNNANTTSTRGWSASRKHLWLYCCACTRDWGNRIIQLSQHGSNSIIFKCTGYASSSWNLTNNDTLYALRRKIN